MGGTVAVTLRKPDGTEYRMNRWTNSMSWGICNLKMLNSDEQHIEDYLHQWKEMRDDYERNKDSGEFEHNMTDCYFPSDGLAPCGYGLVVVDHINKVILDMQGYTSFDTICAASISLEHSGNVLGVQPADADSETQIFKEFLKAGKIGGVLTRDSYNENTPREDWYRPVTETFEEIIAELTSDRRDWFDFKVDLSPWSYEKFEECSPQALRAYRARLIELGFELSDEENKVWDEWIKEYEEEYGEDE